MHKTLYLFLTNPMHHWLFHCNNIRLLQEEDCALTTKNHPILVKYDTLHQKLLRPLCPERMGQKKNKLTNKQINCLLFCFMPKY